MTRTDGMHLTQPKHISVIMRLVEGTVVNTATYSVESSNEIVTATQYH